MSRVKHYLSETPTNEQSHAAIAYLAALDHIETVNPRVVQGIVNELIDQRSNLKLIASENYSSLAVQLTMGNLLTDKYAEGYPFHRFYAGCDNVDDIEDQAQQLLKDIFRCEHAYVQPHSGADANLIALWAILTTRIQNKEVERLGKKNIDELSVEEYEQVRQLMACQKMMGMSLGSGGHLTHGYRHNISSKMLNAQLYDVDPNTELLDYSVLLQQAQEFKPTILMAGYSAHPRRLNFVKLREIADAVGAVLMVDMAHFSGLVAGKVFTGEYDPIPFAHIVTSTTHKTLRGPRGGIVLCTKEFEEGVNKGCPLVLGGPLPHMIAAKAVAFTEANTPSFQSYSHNVVENAQELANALISHGAKLVTGGTENHLVIINLREWGITGRQGESALREAHLTVNRNSIPFDQNGPWYTTGIRIGTPALTTLGMGKEEMREIADIIVSILKNVKPTTVERTGKPSKAKYILDEHILESAQRRVKELLSQFPLYPELQMHAPHFSA